MILNRVNIQNYKSIADMELSLRPGVNLLIGDNGVGKTSVLEAISVGLTGYLRGIVGISGRNILQQDIRIADVSSSPVYMTPASIRCEATLQGQPFSWSRIRKSELGSARTSTSGNGITKQAQALSNDPHSLLPIISYQSTARVVQFKREKYASELKSRKDRRSGYLACLDASLDAKGIKAWCMNMDYAEYKQKREIPEYRLFKEAVSALMMAMDDSNQLSHISYSTYFDDLVYGEPGHELPISYLSAGYQSILWITMDLAYRNTILNPTMQSIADAEGVVLIDEIDMHLHPKWQWRVVPALERVFPKVQFILATHSPFIISSCKNANIISINEAHEINYPSSAYAYAIQDVVELVQGSDAVPKPLRVFSIQFDDALDREDLAEAKKILDTMRANYGDDNTEVRAAAFELDMELDEG
jgi:predicted ATP-binding protein involved in virulence